MSKSKKLKKQKKKYIELLDKIEKIMEYYERGDQVKCSPERCCDYLSDDSIEKEVTDYLDLLIEYSNKIQNLGISVYENHFNISGYRIDNTNNKEEHFELSVNKHDKSINLNGSFCANNIIIRYKNENKINSYFDKITKLKLEITKNTFFEDFNKIYGVSDLSREKSLKDLELD
tara:strand:- start:44251 stop:44772 length:522 start_codon:yes stop_codon:yes gene_type:complete